MTVEKCLIELEGIEMLVYFNDGKKIEEEINNFPLLAAMFEYDFKKIIIGGNRKNTIGGNELSTIFYEFNKLNGYGIFSISADLSFSVDWGLDCNGNIILSEICLEKHEGEERKRTSEVVRFNIESNYNDARRIFDLLKKWL